MDAAVRSSSWPRNAGEPRPLFHGQTALSLLRVEAPGSVEDANGCAAESRSTFDEVLAHYQDAIYRYALHLTGNREAADDLHQETVRMADYRFDRLDASANHRAWLYQIATNAFLRNRQRRSQDGALVQASTESVPTATDSVQSEASGLLREMEAFVANLPLKQRLALIQRTYHDLSYAEIATILRCSEATARIWVYQALRTLRDHFGERL